MTGVPAPKGTGKFKLYDDTNTYSPDKHCIVTPVDENDVNLLISPFDGYTWKRKKIGSMSWEIIIHDISYSEYFTQIKYFKGKTAKFQEHIDEPDIEYDVLITHVTHSYENKDYFRDEAIIKITQGKYK